MERKKTKKVIARVFVAVMVMTVFAVVSGNGIVLVSAEPLEVWVDDDADPTWYDINHVLTIQEGLINVSSNGTVHVYPGIYYENIVWPNVQGITLRSESGPDETVIDGQRLGRVITINTPTDTTPVIDGFTIRNGLAAGLENGGGIFCWDSTPTIENNIVTSNEGYHGGGICLWRPAWPPVSGTVRNNRVTDNIADKAGGGITCLGYTPLIEGNTITNNWARYSGGGILTWSCIDSVIRSNVISSNTAGENAGGILNGMRATAQIHGNTITGNHGGLRGGGIDNQYDSTAELKCNVIKHNDASVLGAALKTCENSVMTITDCIISENGGGGAANCVHCRTSGSLTMTYTEVSNNIGDGIAFESSASGSINFCNIEGNTGYGVRNTDINVTVNAEYNWWGNASGPLGVGPGSGDAVSAYVDYDHWLMPPCEIESSDIAGNKQDTFGVGDSVYVYGSGYATDTTYDLYVVNDTTWTDGMSIPTRVLGTTTSVTTDVSGNIPIGTQIWASSVIGSYDIVVDVNGNEKYDSNIDALDNMYCDVGFETIPEFSTIAIPVAAILGLLFLFSRKRKKKE